MTEKKIVVSALLLLCGCSTQAARTDVLKNRAAFDFNCPKESLQVTDLGGNNMMGVQGCGQRATYVANPGCGSGNAASNCTWIMNTDPAKDGKPVGPTAAP